MKNTRKKMLLSSIAMLLVALVALGSATYAWFTTNPEAAVTGLKMKTTSSKGLVVQTESEKALSKDFSHDAILRCTGTAGHYVTDPTDFDLTPASLTNSAAANTTKSSRAAIGSWLTAKASSDLSYEKSADNATPASAGLTSSQVYAEKVYCKITGENADTTVYLRGLNWTNVSNSESLNDALRVAITDMDGKLVAIYGPDDTANGYLSAATDASNAQTYTPTVKSDSLSIDMGTANGSGSRFFTVYVYIDGEDTNCTTNLCSGASLLDTFTLNLNLKAS